MLKPFGGYADAKMIAAIAFVCITVCLADHSLDSCISITWVARLATRIVTLITQASREANAATRQATLAARQAALSSGLAR